MMKPFLSIAFLAALLTSCGDTTESKSTEQNQEETSDEPNRVQKPEFQAILDQADLKGTILIFEDETNTFYSNDFEWASEGRLPASTFKIVNSIIGLETGVVKDDSTLFKWDGQPRRLKQWEQDLVFHDAFHLSCVPCYQEIARKIGTKRMVDYLKKLDYGSMIVDSSTIDNFWLEGDSKVSAFQQIDFLRRLYRSELPISERTEFLMKDLMVIDDGGETYQLSGKTGWSIRNGHNNGWFVGFIESYEGSFYFAVNVDPNESFNMDLFPKVRSEVAMKAFRKLGII